MQKIKAGSLFFIFLCSHVLIYTAKLELPPKKLSPRSQLIADLDTAMEKVEAAGARATLSALEIRVGNQTVPVATEEEKRHFLLDLATLQNALNKKLLDDVCAKKFSALVVQIGQRYPSLGYTAGLIEKVAVGLASTEGSEGVRAINRMRFGGSVSAGSSPAGVSSTLGSSSTRRSGHFTFATASMKDVVTSSSSSSSSLQGRVSPAPAAAAAAAISETPRITSRSLLGTFERGRGARGLVSRGRALSASGPTPRGGLLAPRRGLSSSASMTTLIASASLQSTPGTGSSGKASSSSLSSSRSVPLLERWSSLRSRLSNKYTASQSTTLQSSTGGDLVPVKELQLDSENIIGAEDSKSKKSLAAQQSLPTVSSAETSASSSSACSSSSATPLTESMSSSMSTT